MANKKTTTKPVENGDEIIAVALKEVKTKTPEPPKKFNPAEEGYVELKDLAKIDPPFAETYIGRDDVMIGIYLDEPCDSLKCLLKSENKNPVGPKGEQRSASSRATIHTLPCGKPQTISVTDFLFLFGDPRMRLDLPEQPTGEEKFKNFQDSEWESKKNQKINLFFRRSTLKQRETVNKNTGQVTKKGYNDEAIIFIDGKCSNDIHGLWDTIPNVWILVPEKLQYVVSPTLDIIDFVEEVMLIEGISTSKSTFTDADIAAVHSHLLAKAPEYKIEKQINSKTSGAYILSLITTVAEQKREVNS